MSSDVNARTDEVVFIRECLDPGGFSQCVVPHGSVIENYAVLTAWNTVHPGFYGLRRPVQRAATVTCIDARAWYQPVAHPRSPRVVAWPRQSCQRIAYSYPRLCFRSA